MKKTRGIDCGSSFSKRIWKRLFSQHFHLLADRLFVDGLQDGAHEFAVHAHLLGLSGTAGQQFLVALCLEYGHVMLLLVLPDVTRNTHAARKQFQQLVVEFVDLRTQFGEALGGD